MKRYLIVLAAASLTASCEKRNETPAPAPQPSATAPAQSSTNPASCGQANAQGFCGVVWGMTADEAIKAFPGGLFDSENMRNDPDFSQCYYLTLNRDGDFVAGFMVVEGKIERFDARAPTIATDKGARVGMKFVDVEALYPGSRREPNHYTAPIEDLTVDLGGGVKAVFEQDEAGLVSSWRIGREPAASYVEGCA